MIRKMDELAKENTELVKAESMATNEKIDLVVAMLQKQEAQNSNKKERNRKRDQH